MEITRDEAAILIRDLGLVGHSYSTLDSTYYYQPGDQPTAERPAAEFYPIVIHSYGYVDRWSRHERAALPKAMVDGVKTA